MFHKQVKLQKDNVTYYCWVPEEYAHVGRKIRVKIEDVWVDNWTVEEVYKERVESNEIEIRSQDYKHQREASDI